MATKESKKKTACSEQDERIQKFEQSLGFKLFDYQKEWVRKMLGKNPPYVYGGERGCCATFLQKYMQSIEKDFREEKA